MANSQQQQEKKPNYVSPKDQGKSQVQFNIKGGSKRRLNVCTYSRSPIGERLLDEVTDILAKEHGVDPEMITVREITPVVFDGNKPKPFVRQFKPSESVEVPSTAVIRSMKKTELIELSTELELDIDPTKAAQMLKPKLLKNVLAEIKKKAKGVDADDDE